MKMKGIVALLTACMLLSSCMVSRKKYEASEAGRWAAIYSRDSLADLLDGSRLLSMGLMKDTALLKGSLKNYQAMLASNQNENQKLNSSLTAKQNELLQKQQELAEREKTIAQLQEMINAQNEKVQSLLKAIVNAQGKKALGKLAEVLNKQTEIDVYIEGHTDNVPIKTAVFQDNWDLSVIRATSVVRILTETYGVSPMQIQPCGRGEFKPVADNETADGRAKNRRTEIIMAPRLDKLFEMLQNN